jgi:hypothetical protein
VRPCLTGIPECGALTRLDHPLFDPPCPHRIRTSYFTSQDDVSHPGSERELVLWGSLGRRPARTWRRAGSPLRRPVSADFPVVAVGSPNVFIKSDCTPDELFETACDAGVGRKVKLNHGIVVVL